MTQFWIAALALGLAAAAIILVPVIRAWARQQGEDRSSSALGVGIVVALAIPVVSMMLYARWSTWDWATGGTTMGAALGGGAAEVHEMDQAIAALEQRLAAQPEDLESWMLLGRSYMSMRRFDQAARVYRQAAALDASSPQVLADFGEALALSDPEGLQGEAGVIFERVLAMSPSHPKGLWYGGLNAYENANWALAEQRLGILLTLDPPQTLVPHIEERLAAARAHGAGMPPQAAPPTAESSPEDRAGAIARAEATAPEAVAPEPAVPEPAAPGYAAPETAAPAPAAPAAAADAIQLDVSLDPVLVAGVPGNTPVFIIARNPGGGPPLAVVRATAAELPMSVRLTDANAMMEGVTILDQAELELIARVSLSGSPAQRPGDLYGAVNYVRGNSGSTRLRIDRIAE